MQQSGEGQQQALQWPPTDLDEAKRRVVVPKDPLWCHTQISSLLEPKPGGTTAKQAGIMNK